MSAIKSLLPTYLQAAIDDYNYVSKDIYVLTPAYLACRQFFHPAAMPILIFTISTISTKLVIKHFSTYSNEGIAALKKCIRPISERLLLTKTIAAIATVILYQFVNRGYIVMSVSGIFFGLIHPIKVPDNKPFVIPRRPHFNCRKNILITKEIS